jgi:predicted RNase H-like nuclease (RuvC/YqgF family)
MDEALKQRLGEIRTKVENLLGENMRLRGECQAQAQRVAELEEMLEQQKNTVSEITEQNKMIKLAKNLSLSGGDNFDVKIKINEVVREIDRCIDLLNE